MGYTTDFSGEFTFDRPLAPEHHAYLVKFNETRRMARDAARTAKLPDPVREAAGIAGVGLEGGYYVGAGGSCGQENTPDVLNYNAPPNGQPHLWCKWVPNEAGTTLSWDGGEKFYDYVEWLVYLIDHFIAPWGYKLNGRVLWAGEDSDDTGVIYVRNNKVKAIEDEYIRQEPDVDEWYEQE